MNSTSATNINSLIAQLVRERSTLKNTDSGQNRTSKLSQNQKHSRNLATEPVYLLKLTVKVGVQSLKLDGSHLGIRDSVLRLLEDSARGGYAAKISHRLLDAANKLQARQKIIYNRYTVLSEPFRLVHESSLPQALEAIEEMLAEANQLRLQIVEAYQQEYTSFLRWAYQVLSEAALEPAEIETALRKYANAYPTKEEIKQNSLQVLVEGPLKMPSLLEEAKREEAELVHEAQKRSSEVEREKLRLLARAQETLQQTLISTLYDAQIRSRDEAHAKLASLLESFNIAGPEATGRTGQKWDTLISRLEVLTTYDPNLEPLVNSAKQIQSLYLAPTPNLEEVQQVMEDFRAMLKERLRQDAAGSSGAQMLTKALTFDSDYSGLIKQLDAIALCPDPEQLRELKGKLAAMENIFKFRSKDLHKRWFEAENAVRKSLGLELLGTPQTSQAPAPEPNQPYDDEAGF